MDITSLTVPLPEDILKKKWAGDLSGAIAAIDYRLTQELPRMLRERLRLERAILHRLPTQYPYDRAQAMEKMIKAVPDFTEAELDQLDLSGRIDFIYLNGEKRYFVRFHKSLMKTDPKLMARSGVPPLTENRLLDSLVARMKQAGSLSAHIHLKAEMRLEQGDFIPGETYRAHLPLPIGNETQSQIELIRFEPEAHGIAPEAALQRTVYYEKQLKENRPFCAEYRYVNRMVYADLSKPAPKAPLYPDAMPPTPRDLSPEEPCMVFTPYLKQLARDLRGIETNPLLMARRFYDFVTTKITYAFVRDYFQIEHLGEYAAVNLMGDCGIQALLFILLCRISGIPARWQSGLAVSPDYTGSHDWAQFYIEGWGWLFCDCSYGGGAYRHGNMERWHFYFGNLEPLRMAANRAYAAALDFPKEHLRIDPYDNQSGEIECLEKGFDGRQVDTEYTLMDLTYE